MAGQSKRVAKVHPIRVPQAQPAIAMIAARLHSFDAATRTAQVTVGRELVDASLDEALSTRVLETALARGERVVVQKEEAEWVVLGALRTAPTPGVDECDELVIEARRVLVKAEHEFSVVSGMASIVVRAQGYIETLAQDITTRASSVHKIVGRMIRLN